MKNSFLKTVKKNVVIIHRLNPSYLPLSILRTILRTIQPFIPILLGAKVLDQLHDKCAFEEVFVTVLLMVGLTTGIELICNAMGYGISIKRGYLFDTKNNTMSQKAITMDYDILERKKTLEMLAKAMQSSDALGGLPQYLETLLSMISSVASLITALVSVFGLFGAAVVTDRGGLYYFMTSPYSTIILLILIAISVFINSTCERKNGKLNYEASVQKNEFTRIYWFFFNLIFDQSMGKDIRLFRMQPLVEAKQRDAQEKIEAVQKQTLRKTIRIEALSTFAYQTFLLVAYFFIGVKAVLGIISIGELTKYVGMILLIQGRVSTVFSTLAGIKNHNIYIKDYTDCMEIQNQKHEGTLPVEERADNAYELEFRNVSFHYPNNEAMILKNISFRLRVGQKLAIVGPNGAGKTTFIKLLCRLYDPTEGEILLNGIDIKQYSYEEYQRLFAVVFQDFQIFAFPLAENVAGSAEYDEAEIRESLRKAGILERAEQLPQGLQTRLMRDQQEDGEEGIEISGGERQKVALARALYRNSPIVILDEPTSALDPMAEQDIYERFNDMVKEKTAVFISHRMSSCRFCDEVIVFEDGQIVEEGSHEELVHKDGLYAKMWQSQAQYYAEQEA